nr:MAG TPA: hypothetical protein [Caudoviricetes sp.]DAI53458.1 MAG TPA: hypothetical protein [Caudoviricetes sp.]
MIKIHSFNLLVSILFRYPSDLANSAPSTTNGVSFLLNLNEKGPSKVTFGDVATSFKKLIESTILITYTFYRSTDYTSIP